MLFQAIKHGDEEHQVWLKKAIEDHFAGRTPEAPRGSGTKEAHIAALRAALLPFATFGAKLNASNGAIPEDAECTYLRLTGIVAKHFMDAATTLGLEDRPHGFNELTE